MVSDSCKKRFGKIMMEEMELVAQEEMGYGPDLLPNETLGMALFTCSLSS